MEKRTCSECGDVFNGRADKKAYIKNFNGFIVEIVLSGLKILNALNPLILTPDDIFANII